MIKGLEMREIFEFFSLKAHPSMNMVAEENVRYFVRIHRFKIYRALLL